MKSYNHLYGKYLSDENYYAAVRNATKHKGGKKRKHQTARYYRDQEEELKPVIIRLARDFRNDKHTPILIYDGIRRKQRYIVVPTMREQIIHHMVVNIMKPIFMQGMYEHSYGSIPDRGAHSAKKVVEKWIAKGGADCKYCLKMDIKKYFDSVPHDILKAKLAKIIHDRKFLAILFEIVDVTEVGIPIGFYTSQWFANWYLTELDHYIKEELHAKYYIRYMDDMVIFGGNKRTLHEMQRKIEAYLRDRLGLEMKSNWQVFRFHFVKKNEKEIGRALDFMGFRFYRNRTVLRKQLMLKATRKARRICKKRKNVHDCRQMLSYLGWIDCTNTYGMYKLWIKPFISFGRLKKYVSIYQIRENRRLKELCGTNLKTAV